MKKITVIMICFAAMMISGGISGQAEQDTTKIYKIVTLDGNEFIGRPVYEDSVIIRISTHLYGEIDIPLKNIKTRETLFREQIKGDKIWPVNYQDSRYFFAPNGYGLRGGEAYYQNVMVLYNQFSVGITNNVSLGGGMVPLFLFAGSPTPVWVTPKVSIPISKNKFNIGAGALIGGVIGAEESGFGIVYGTATIGSRDQNVSFGMGYGYLQGNFADRPMFNLSMMFRISPNSYFMSENYYISIDEEYLLLFSLGGRSVVRRVGLDYGLFMPIFPDQERFVAIPWFGITVPLSKPKADRIK